MDVQMTLRKLVEVQLEQNELAVQIAGWDAQSSILAHMRFLPGVRHSPEMARVNEETLRNLRAKFEANQEKLRQLYVEVAMAPSVT